MEQALQDSSLDASHQPSYTPDDVLNAIIYANRLTTRRKLESYRRKNKYFRDIIVTEVDWPSYFHLPPKLAEQRDFRSYFAEQACSALSCYVPIRPQCQKDGGTRQLHFQHGTYEACQPSCSEVPAPYETVYRDGRCLVGNTKFKNWCLFPIFRAAGLKVEVGKTDVPPFVWVDGTQECKIPREYCDYFNVDYDEGSADCYVGAGQNVAELLFGKTLVREAKSLNLYVQERWSEDLKASGANRKTRSADTVEPYDPYRDLMTVLEEFWGGAATSRHYVDAKIQNRIRRRVLGFIHDLSLETALVNVPALLKHSVAVSYRSVTKLAANPIIRNLAAQGQKRVVHAAVRAMVINAVSKFASKQLAVFTVLNAVPVSAALSYVMLTGIVLDAFDPRGLNNQMTMATVKLMARCIEEEERLTYSSWPFELTPEYLITQFEQQTQLKLEDGDDEQNEAQEGEDDDDVFFLETFVSYLFALEVNSLGEKLDTGSDQTYDLNQFLCDLNAYKCSLLQVNAECFVQAQVSAAGRATARIVILCLLSVASFLLAHIVCETKWMTYTLSGLLTLWLGLLVAAFTYQVVESSKGVDVQETVASATQEVLRAAQRSHRKLLRHQHSS